VRKISVISQEGSTITTTNENWIELTDEELKRVSGGRLTCRKRGENPIEY